MRIKIDAEGDDKHFSFLVTELADLVKNCVKGDIPLDASVTVKDDELAITITCKQESLA